MIIIHIMLEFYCLVFFGCSVAIFKRGVVSVSQFFKGSDGRYWLTILSKKARFTVILWRRHVVER